MRNTDADWEAIGVSEPFFGVLTNDEFRSGALDEQAVARFYQSGVGDIDYVVSVARRTVGMPANINKICDFGTGVGRLAFALASHGKEVLGVDISDGMRKEGEQRARQRSVSNVSFVTTIPADKFDWVNSLIVFQHIPPARGIGLFRQLVEALNPGGLLTIQLTYARDKRHVGELLRDMGEYVYDGESVRRLSFGSEATVGEMSMFDYDLNAVFRTLHRCGIGSVYTEHTDHGGCHGMRLFARR